jgi:hypothetical protein
MRGATARKAAWLLHQRSISVHQRSGLGLGFLKWTTPMLDDGLRRTAARPTLR